MITYSFVVFYCENTMTIKLIIIIVFINSGDGRNRKKIIYHKWFQACRVITIGHSVYKYGNTFMPPPQRIPILNIFSLHTASSFFNNLFAIYKKIPFRFVIFHQLSPIPISAIYFHDTFQPNYLIEVICTQLEICQSWNKFSCSFIRNPNTGSAY